jgi:hypothetical protein
MYRKVFELNLNDKEHISYAIKGLIKCLEDAQLSVKLEAALSLSQFLEVHEAKEICRPELQKVLEKYLKISCEIDS